MSTETLHELKLDLVATAAAIAQAEEMAAAHGIRRDDLIRKLSDSGVSRREVADLASITPGRVQQLLSGSLFKVQLSEGTPVFADGKSGPRGRSTDWEGIARSEAAAVKAAQAHWRTHYGEPFRGGAVSVERAGTPA